MARAHYRFLEADKLRALKLSSFNYDAPCVLSSEACTDLDWMLTNIFNASAPIRRDLPVYELFVDAAKSGWGAKCASFHSQGFFSASEIPLSINTKETLAIFYAVKSFQSLFINKHILIRSDNSTAVSVVRKMGSMSSAFRNLIASRLWDLAEEHNSWFSVSHIAGSLNLEADFYSHNLNEHLEWSLPYSVFQELSNRFQSPQVDLFATRLNTQLPVYCSWLPDPFASFSDAFTLNWSRFNLSYAFPPFILLSRVLAKIIQDKATVLLVFPLWPAQPWFPRIKMLATRPIHHPSGINSPVFTLKPQSNPSSSGSTPLSLNDHIRRHLILHQLPIASFPFLRDSRGMKTRKTYSSALLHWLEYAFQRNLSCETASLNDFVEYFIHTFQQGRNFNFIRRKDHSQGNFGV